MKMIYKQFEREVSEMEKVKQIVTDKKNTKKQKSKIIESIKSASLKESEKAMNYGDYCDWHDTCDCNE